MKSISYSAESVTKILRAKLLQHHSTSGIEHLLPDSRKLTFPSTTLFIAIQGDRRNGHEFVYDLYKQGVRNFLVSEEIDLQKLPEANVIHVKDTIRAMQALAAAHRKNFDIPVIGITGSNGKTIVKEWLNQLLEPNFNIVRSPKSYNSQTGVPLSVWQMEDYHTLGIFEAGISQSDEMAHLAKVIQPTIGVFTNVGNAHNEGFLNVRQKINEKLQLFAKVSILILCRDYMDVNECVVNLKERIKSAEKDYEGFKTFSWTRNGLQADVEITKVEKQNNFTSIEAVHLNEVFLFTIPFIDDASIENAINCWMVLRYLQIPPEQIAQRMSSLHSVAMRLELKNAVNNCSLINDSYNSDLNSLSIALDFLNQQKQHKGKTVVLSDILQSGLSDMMLYDQVAQLLQSKGVTRIIGIGKNIGQQKKYFETIEHLEFDFFESTNAFLKQLDLHSFHDEVILLKGARSFEFEKISSQLEEKQHETVLEINLNNVVFNLQQYQSLLKPTVKLMAMVKAFSYGSGSFEIANVLQQHKVDYLAVAYADEGVDLRKNNIHLPIMVMNPEQKSFETILQYHLEPEIFSLKSLHQFLQVAKNHPRNEGEVFGIHLELETGMNRLGIEADQISSIIDLLKQNDFVKVKSVFSHLVGSEDAAHDEFSKQQINSFSKMSNEIISALGYPVLRHVVNSAGITRFSEAHFDMVRLGLGLYGIDSSHVLTGRLKSVSTLKTTISQIKNLTEQQSIGYGRSEFAKGKIKIATVGIGYADGLSRGLSNGKGKMSVKGKLVPIIGKICMDMTMLDVTDIPQLEEGDEVIVFGNDPTIEQLSQWSNTIPYEVMTNISQRVKRVYFQE